MRTVVIPSNQRATEQTPRKAVSKRAQEDRGPLNWVFTTDGISKVEGKFRCSATEVHRTRPDGSDLMWKQIGISQVSDSGELPFFIEWLTADHPARERKAVAAIEKITIADTDHLSDS